MLPGMGRPPFEGRRHGGQEPHSLPTREVGSWEDAASSWRGRQRLPVWLRVLGMVCTLTGTALLLLGLAALFGAFELLRLLLGPLGELASLLESFVLIPLLAVVVGCLGGVLFLCVVWSRGERFAPALSAATGLILTLCLLLWAGSVWWPAFAPLVVFGLPGLVYWLRSA